MKLLHTSTDAKSAVDLVVSQIASNDIQTSLQALHQVKHCTHPQCVATESGVLCTVDYDLMQSDLFFVLL